MAASISARTAAGSGSSTAVGRTADVTATEVQGKLLRARLDQANGLPVQAERQTVAQFLEGWLEYSIKAAVRPPTFKQYKQHVRLYLTPDLGRYQLAKLTPQDVSAHS